MQSFWEITCDAKVVRVIRPPGYFVGLAEAEYHLSLLQAYMRDHPGYSVDTVVLLGWYLPKRLRKRQATDTTTLYCFDIDGTLKIIPWPKNTFGTYKEARACAQALNRAEKNYRLNFGRKKR